MQAASRGSHPLPGKAPQQPTNSGDSAQTAQEGAHQPPTCTAVVQTAVGDWRGLLGHGGLPGPAMSPHSARMAIREALTPLSPAELAAVQEQLRQSRLARQSQPLCAGPPAAWCDAAAVVAAPGPTHSSHTSCCSSTQQPHHYQQPQQQQSAADPAFGEVVRQVAAGLSRGSLAQEDVMRVLRGLDPAVLLQQQPPLPPLPPPPPPPASLQLAPQPRCRAQLPAAHAQPHAHAHQHLVQQQQPPQQQHHHARQRQGAPGQISSPVSCAASRPPPGAAGGRYHGVLSSLRLPVAAVAAHAADAAAAAAVGASPSSRHPGSAAVKGQRSGSGRSRRPRRAAWSGAGLLQRPPSPQQQQPAGLPHPAAMVAQEGGSDSLAGCQRQQRPVLLDLPALPHAQHGCLDWARRHEPVADVPPHQQQPGCGDDALLVAPRTFRGSSSDAAAWDESGGCCAAPAAGTSLRERWARLAPAVQAGLLLQLEELAAGEEELRAARGGGGSAEPQGPRRSGRARRVRDWDSGRFTTQTGHSASPPPAGPHDDGTPAPHTHCQEQAQAAARPLLLSCGSGNYTRCQLAHGSPQVRPAGGHGAASGGCAATHHHPERLCLGPPASPAPAAPAAAAAGGAAAHDEWGSSAFAAPAAAADAPPAPKRRRITRRAGPRAEARKAMHRASFRRARPQRAPGL